MFRLGLKLITFADHANPPRNLTSGPLLLVLVLFSDCLFWELDNENFFWRECQHRSSKFFCKRNYSRACVTHVFRNIHRDHPSKTFQDWTLDHWAPNIQTTKDLIRKHSPQVLPSAFNVLVSFPNLLTGQVCIYFPPYTLCLLRSQFLKLPVYSEDK